MKALVTFLMVITLQQAACCQERSVQTATTTIVVPEAVKTTFEKEFPGLQPSWEADGKNFKAIYADPKTNSKGIIIYDGSGQAIRRDVVATPSVPQ